MSSTTQDHKTTDDSGSRADRASLLKRLKPLLKWFVILVVLVFLTLTIQRAYKDVQAHRDHLDLTQLDWRLLLLGVFAYAVGMIPAAIAWLQTLFAFGQRVPFWRGLYIYFLGHLGKYVPGKAMVFVLRVGQLVPYGVEVKPAVVSVFVETLTSIGTGAILGSLFLITQRPAPPAWMTTGAVLCIPIAAVCLAPHTFRIFLTLLSKSKIGRMPRSVSQAFTWTMMLRTCSWMLLGWILHGTAGWLVLQGIHPTPELANVAAWATCVAAITLGAVVGFASMLPGGAVVRELIITWLLSQIVPQPTALVAAILFRIANLAAEFLILGVLSVQRFWGITKQRSAQ